jgi:hypothetical protein
MLLASGGGFANLRRSETFWIFGAIDRYACKRARRAIGLFPRFPGEARAKLGDYGGSR